MDKAALQAKLDQLQRRIEEQKKVTANTTTRNASTRPNQWVRPGAPVQPAASSTTPVASSSKRPQMSWKNPNHSSEQPKHSTKSAKPKMAEPKRNLDNSAKEYLYGSVYHRSADGFKLVRSEQGASKTPPLPPPPPALPPQSSHAPQHPGVSAQGNERGVKKRDIKSVDPPSSTPGPRPPFPSSLDGGLDATSATLSEGEKEENMEAALKRARRHLAASGHIARALAKRKAKEEKPAKRLAAKLAKDKSAREHKEAQRAKAEAYSNQQKSKPCSFFVRQGNCALGDRCPYLHDRSMVAVCQPFLAARSGRGEGCLLGSACPLSHDMASSTDLMPVCTSFLQGSCVNPSCPYRHVKVNRQAQVCPSFLRTGVCEKGAECPLKHPARISRAPVLTPATRPANSAGNDSSSPPSCSASASFLSSFSGPSASS